MAEGLNRVTLIGNLGMDPELKFTQSGQAILRMRLATTERYVKKDGEKAESTQWHTVILWGKRGEALAKFLTKGKTIVVEGRIEYRSYEDKDGNKRTSTEINASNIVLLGGGERAERREEPRKEAPAQAPANDGFDDGDIPF